MALNVWKFLATIMRINKADLSDKEKYTQKQTLLKEFIGVNL